MWEPLDETMLPTIGQEDDEDGDGVEDQRTDEIVPPLVMLPASGSDLRWHHPPAPWCMDVAGGQESP